MTKSQMRHYPERQNPKCDKIPNVSYSNPEGDIILNIDLPHISGPLQYLTYATYYLTYAAYYLTNYAYYLTHAAYYLTQSGQDKQMTQPTLPIIRITPFMN